MIKRTLFSEEREIFRTSVHRAHADNRYARIAGGSDLIAAHFGHPALGCT